MHDIFSTFCAFVQKASNQQQNDSSYVISDRLMIGLCLLCIAWLSIWGPTSGDACLPDKERLVRAKETLDTVGTLIYQRFELHKLQQLQLFLVSSNIHSRTWDTIKLKLAKKLLVQGSNFTMVFGGTGVTAGYDNYLHQSYPMIIEKRLSPVFKQLGVNLVVRNIGQIHVDCRLSNYCYDAMGGEDADVIGWENSFDCGAAKDAHEFIARVAGWKGAVIHYSTSGAFPIDDCPPAEDKVPWVEETWTPDKAGVADRISLDATNVQDFKMLQDAWAAAGSAAARFARPLGDKYNGVGAHGFSLWTKSTIECDYANTHNHSSVIPGRLYSALTTDLARMQAERSTENQRTRRLFPEERSENLNRRQLNNNYKRKPLQPKLNAIKTIKSKASKATTVSLCEVVKLKGKCHADGGPHWRVQESAHYGNAQQRGRKWHPTIGMHLLRAEVFVYTYLHIIMDALLMMEADSQRALQAIESESNSRDSKNSNNNRKKKKKSKSSTVTAPQSLCTAATEAVARDYHAKLAALQVPIPVVPLHCAPQECATMPQCYTDYLPNYNAPHLLKSVIVGDHLGWYAEAALANDHNPELGLLDKKHYYKSEGSKNEIHLQLTGVRSHVRLYARSKKEPLDEALFILDPHIHVMHNTSLYHNILSSYRPTARRYTLSGANYSIELNYASVPVPAGDHVLTIMTAPSNPFAISSLSHVVVF